MIVRVKLFAAAKEKAGQGELELDLPTGATVADLRAAIAKNHPQLAQLAAHAMWAINTTYANDQTPITPNSEIALISPVSGG
jgi:molybdopterin converting factor subunit 1